MQGAGASSWDLKLQLSLSLRNGVRVGEKCRARNVSLLGLKLNSKSCSRYLEFLTCVPSFYLTCSYRSAWLTRTAKDARGASSFFESNRF